MIKWTSLFLILGLLACDKGSSTLPLSRNELKSVLYDIHLLEAKLEEELKEQDSINIQESYDSLFALHGVSEKDFQETYKSYAQAYPKELDSIYSDLLEEYQVALDTMSLIQDHLERSQ